MRRPAASAAAQDAIHREEAMKLRDITLDARYDLDQDRVLLNGTQALVRLMLMQKARDRAAGHNTAGYVTGYRGSPLGAVDLQMARARRHLEANDILFRPGLNEDLAATALWGTQQINLRGEGRYDGVFGLWYGKGPGVDRSGDVMRHANMAGTAPLGGVLMVMGDDHTGESSTVLHQSDFAMIDAYMPVLSPAGVQEILDLGLFGYALSRYAGVWVGLKAMKDTIEVTEVVEADPLRLDFVTPTDFEMPPGGLNIRLLDDRIQQEARLFDYKRFAAEAFARANRLDRRVHGRPGARIGLVAAGKNWLDLVHAMEMLGLDEAECTRLGITTYKVGMVWPLDMASFHEWAEGLDLIVVVEEKRKLIEVQVKEAIFDDRRGRRVWGHKDGEGRELFPTRYALDPVTIAEKLGDILIGEGRDTDRIRAGLARVAEAKKAANAPQIATRLPWFCSGCPHNTSTRLPEGARAYAGIGCHFMVQWMNRDTLGFTHMGGEGANWIGEAPFVKRRHVFQNLGDGTYDHSGVQAIRAALAAGVNITYKILFNDAVAMTGGQKPEGDLTPWQIAHELRAMGVKHVAVVHDEKEPQDPKAYPDEVTIHPRDELIAVEERFQEIEGVSAIIYVQTCAAEKRRRRKRGEFPDPPVRVFINPDVCEGCGDCGVQSNCVSIVPRETPFGRKRAIDQSSCNKDYSCLRGFCPALVTVEGGEIRKEAGEALPEGALEALPAPDLPAIEGTHNLVITGIGGTGIVTVGALLAMAAHLEGKAAGVMEMAGLAQKGGAVHVHCRLAERPEDISAIRVALGEADGVIGGDLVVTGGAETLRLMGRGRTKVVCNAHEIVTGDFTANPELKIPVERLRLAIEARTGDGNARFLDATALAARLLGDAIFANTIVLGAAWQSGLVPLSREAIRRAITLNGAAVEGNLEAFEIGRWAALHPEEAARIARPGEEAAEEETLAGKIDRRAAHLAAWAGGRRGQALARRYRETLAGITDEELREAVALGWHRLLAFKDEWEVARLHAETLERHLAEEFSGAPKVAFHLAPPLLARKGPDGRPRKIRFGGWMLPLFRLMAAARGLRGSWLDPFRLSADRRLERALLATYEADMAEILPRLGPQSDGKVREAAVELFRLPLQIRGFGPVKEAAAEKAARRRAALRATILGDGTGGAAPLRHAAE